MRTTFHILLVEPDEAGFPASGSARQARDAFAHWKVV